ncbi:glycosyltransferase [Paracoccus litorisediminis]|nr:glycosyltransferase [Paracoccus litorisediminis]
MSAKDRLIAEIDAALALARAGGMDQARLKQAWAALDRIAADPQVGLLGQPTQLGLPRKLHSARLRLAKLAGDPVQMTGLRATAVPPQDLLADLFPADPATRAAHARAAGQPVTRMVHQLWVGGPVPPNCGIWRAWALRHGWDYRLWQETDLARLGVTSDPLYLAMRAAGDLPGAVDVARYHVLAHWGGLYLDCDWYPIRPELSPEDILPPYGLSAIPEAGPRLVGGAGMLLANGTIATPPQHPAILWLLQVLPEFAARLPGTPAWWQTGPLPFTLAARRGPVNVLDIGLLGGSVPRGTPLAEVQAKAQELAAGPGAEFLLEWKSW